MDADKPANKVMKKEQLNARIPGPLRLATNTVAASLGWKKEEIVEVALASVLGSKDRLVLAKREKIQEKSKELDLSFEFPNHRPDWALA